LPEAEKTAELFLKLKNPDFKTSKDFVSLKPEEDAPLISGKIMSLSGTEAVPEDYARFIDERVMPYSTAKFSTFNNRMYNVGALARINTNYKKLSSRVRELLEKSGLKPPLHNPYHNNLAQALELVHWIEQVQKLLCRKYEFEGLPDIKPCSGRGVSAVEAPRGILFHDYTLDNKGLVEKSNIITPTAQNLRAMEDDVKELIQALLERNKKKQKIVLEVEKLIRAYDPCFSCSAHFLKVKWVKK